MLRAHEVEAVQRPMECSAIISQTVCASNTWKPFIRMDHHKLLALASPEKRLFFCVHQHSCFCLNMSQSEPISRTKNFVDSRGSLSEQCPDILMVKSVGMENAYLFNLERLIRGWFTSVSFVKLSRAKRKNIDSTSNLRPFQTSLNQICFSVHNKSFVSEIAQIIMKRPNLLPF